MGTNNTERTEMKFIDIPTNQRVDLLNILEGRIGLKPAIIEKDLTTKLLQRVR